MTAARRSRIRRPLLIVGVTAAGMALPFASSSGPRLVQASGPFTTPQVIAQNNAGEPEIKIAPDGTVYIDEPTGLLSSLPGSASLLYRSDNAGSSWVLTPPGLRANLPGGGDAAVSIGSDGTVHFADLWLGSSSVSVSHDKGQTWTGQPLGGLVVQDRQWLATTSSATYLSYHQIPAGIIVSKSVDGGLTFPISTSAATPVDQTGCVCPPGNLIAEDGGLLGDRVGAIYATSTGGVKFAGSTNGALTFTNSAVWAGDGGTTDSAFPVVADAGGGHLYAVWLDVLNNTSTVWFNSSSNFGATWGTARAIVAGGANVYPWVAAQGSKVSVSVYHNATTATPDTAPAGTQWFESYLESTDGGATFSALQTLDTTPVKTGPICTQGTGCSANRELLDFQSVAIDSAGRANVAYVHSIDNVSKTELRYTRQS